MHSTAAAAAHEPLTAAMMTGTCAAPGGTAASCGCWTACCRRARWKGRAPTTACTSPRASATCASLCRAPCCRSAPRVRHAALCACHTSDPHPCFMDQKDPLMYPDAWKSYLSWAMREPEQQFGTPSVSCSGKHAGSAAAWPACQLRRCWGMCAYMGISTRKERPSNGRQAVGVHRARSAGEGGPRGGHRGVRPVQRCRGGAQCRAAQAAGLPQARAPARMLQAPFSLSSGHCSRWPGHCDAVLCLHAALVASLSKQTAFLCY